MSKTLIPAQALYGAVSSTDNSYASAASGNDGTKTVPSTTSGHAPVGQTLTDTTFTCWELFLRFNLGAIDTTDSLLASVAFRLASFDAIAGAGWDLEIRDKNWGDVLNISDWVPRLNLGDSTRIATVEAVNSITSDKVFRAGSNAFRDRIAEAATPMRVMLNSSRHRGADTPGSPQYRSLYGPNAATAALRPYLEAYQLPRSTLAVVGGACRQLSDGTHVYLHSNGSTTPTISLRHRDHSAVETIITTLSTGTGSGSFRPAPAYQAIDICVDDNDNIYVVGNQGSGYSTVLAKAYSKGIGYVWTARTALTADLTGYAPGRMNNVSCAWHRSEDGPRIMVAAAHSPGTGVVGQWSYAVLDSATLLTGSGTLLVQTYPSPTWMDFHLGADSAISYPNEIGTNLEVIPETGGTRGVIISHDGNETINLGKYDLDGPEEPHVGPIVTAPKDANSKFRGTSVAGRGYAALVGGLILLRSWNGTKLGQVSVASAVAGVPSISQFASSSNWDMVYDTASQKIWVYYIDRTNAQKLMRIGVSMVSFTVDTTPVQVSGAVGAVGSLNQSIRVPRGKVDERSVLIHVANYDSTTRTTLGYGDSFNVAPSPPVLVPRDNFDARVDTVFDWAFVDPNLFDKQSAFRLQIVDTSDDSIAFDTTKTASVDTAYILPADTLTNGNAYKWRVRVYDAADLASEYSAYLTFGSVEQGVVAITDPALDNITGIVASEYTVRWTYTSVSGAVQEQRRVRVVRTVGEAEISDTGFDTTADRTFQIETLESDTEYRIEVTVIDSDDLTSNTATRLITPHYEAPDLATVSVTAGPFWIDIQVMNPTATGSRPTALYNLIYRRPAGGVDDLLASEISNWVGIGRCDVSGTYRDYTCAAGVDYEYAVMTVA